MDSRERAERRGQVFRGGTPAVGVTVSDGRAVAVTDGTGWYRLPPAQAGSEDLVWVCVPAGCRPASPWYRHTNEAPVFHLEGDPSQTDGFSFVFFTDVHLIPGRSEQPFAAVLREIAAISPAPAFWVHGGDVEIDNGMGETLRALLADLPFPGRHVVGNHDLLVGEPDPLAAFRTLFGPVRCSWDYGRFHFVTLCALAPNPAQEGWRNVEGELSAEELAWLESDLRLAAGRPVIVFLHIPPVSTFPERQDAASGQEPAWEVRNTGRFLALCEQYNIRLVLSGHFHENERIRSGRTVFQTTGAVCGHWWERGGRPKVNLDGSPKGYRIVYIDGEETETIFRGIGVENKCPLAIVEPPPGAGVEESLTIGVNVFDGDSDTCVEYRIGAGGWQPMRLAPRQAAPGGLSGSHYWAARAAAPPVPGTYLLSVRVTLPDGVAHTEQRAFFRGGARRNEESQ